MSPVEIVAGIRADDPEACRELVDAIYRAYRATADQHLRLDAEDALQEAALTAVLQIRSGQLRDPQALYGWLSRVVRSRIISYWRRAHLQMPSPHVRAFEAEAHRIADTRPNQEARALNAEKLALAWRALEAVPPVPREAFLRFHIEEEPVLSIAKRMGLPESTVKTHLRRTRMRLAKAA